MAQGPVSYPSASRYPLAALLRAERERQGFTQVDVARRVRQAASDEGVRDDRTNADTVRRWETGATIPYPSHQRWIAAGLGLELATVTAAAREQARLREVGIPPLVELPGSAEPVDDGAAATIDLARRLTLVEVDSASLDTLEGAVHRMARAYSTTPPARLLPQVQTRLAQVDGVLQRRVTPEQHTRLLVAAGWLHLLLAALHFDLGQREPAHISRDAALYAGQQAHDPDVTGWAWETLSWFSLTEGRPQDALAFAEQGRAVASRGSGGHVQLTMKIAIAQAQLGERAAAERALEEAAAEISAMSIPEYPDHHFVFDPPKWNHYASQVYAWLDVPDLVEEHAREVLRQSNNPRWLSWVPSRVANVRLDLASVLLSRGRLDEAFEEASRSLDGLIRHDTLVRAVQVGDRFEQRYPTARQSHDFGERLTATQEDFYTP